MTILPCLKNYLRDMQRGGMRWVRQDQRVWRVQWRLGNSGSEPLVPDQTIPLHSEKKSSKKQQRLVSPRNHHHNRSRRDSNRDGNREEKKDTHNNDPTPLHQNCKSFQEQNNDDHEDKSQQPQSNSQRIEQAKDDEQSDHNERWEVLPKYESSLAAAPKGQHQQPSPQKRQGANEKRS